MRDLLVTTHSQSLPRACPGLSGPVRALPQQATGPTTAPVVVTGLPGSAIEACWSDGPGCKRATLHSPFSLSLSTLHTPPHPCSPPHSKGQPLRESARAAARRPLFYSGRVALYSEWLRNRNLTVHLSKHRNAIGRGCFARWRFPKHVRLPTAILSPLVELPRVGLHTLRTIRSTLAHHGLCTCTT